MWEELNHAVAISRRRQHTVEDCIDVPVGVMIGRYICASDFLPALEMLSRPDLASDFIDAFGYLATRCRLVAMPFAAAWWHCGDPTQLMRAVLDHAVADPQMGHQIREYLKKVLD
jgi:UTP-glucose-1-phosphate uridylyltransferase